MSQDYRWVVDLYHGASGAPLGRASLDPDFEPAEQCTRFHLWREGRIADAEYGAPAVVEPRWHDEHGAPRVAGFRVDVHPTRGRPAGRAFDIDYFGQSAHAASSDLVARGRLARGDRFLYTVAAFPIRPPTRTEQAAEKPTDPAAAIEMRAMQVRDVSPAPVVRPGELESYFERAGNRQGSAPVDGEPPVFLPSRVLSEAAARARRAGAREVGGALIGHLHRDGRGGEIFVSVEAQVPATHTRSDVTSLTFTPETWTEVRRVIELRGSGETLVGWYHSHPVHEWSCKHCPPERRRVCPLASDFLSDEDRIVHRSIFPAAFHVALVVNQIALDEQTYSMFGWTNGVLRPRGFHVLEQAGEGLPRPAAAG